MLDCPSGSLAACAPVGHGITDGSLGTGNATALFDIDANFTNKSQTRHLRIAE